MSYKCRLCESPLSIPFVDLGATPPSNAYLTEADLEKPETWLPLKVFVCGKCKLVQLPAHATPEQIFGKEYLYFSSYSQAWVEHARRYAIEMQERLDLDGQSFVVEVASNDGYLLQHFKAMGIGVVLGVEPAPNVAQVANERGIPTVVQFFGGKTAREIRDSYGKADLVCGANVLAHVPDLHDFIEGISLLLAPLGIATMEFPHLLKLIERVQFDTIYHEHFSYFSLLSVSRAFEEHGLELFDVEELETHGGSVRIYVSHARRKLDPSKRLVRLRQEETEKNLDKLSGYFDFEPRVQAIKYNLLDFLLDARRADRKVAGYGAPAKSTTLLNYCGIRADLLPFLVEDSPHKQGRYMPGSRIPIFAPDKLAREAVDDVLIMPWNLYAEIGAKAAKLISSARILNPVSLP